MEDVQALDALEEELDAKLDAMRGVDPNEATWAKVELKPLVIDIPF